MFYDKLLPSLSTRLSLPSAAELEASNFEFQGPFPEYNVALDRPEMSLTWLKSAFSRSSSSMEKTALAQDESYAETRRSADLESLVSTDASTLLEEDRPVNRSAAKARIISDAIIGLSDGLTVPFALTAGLSALGDTRVVIFGGVAELIAGAISMGLGGYLGAKSEE